jgi:Flp pilus assembly protein TadD
MLNDQLETQEFQQIESHMEGCPTCQATLDRLLTEAGDAMPLVPGYEVREEVGRGGMGVVWRVHDPDFNRDLAVKVLREEFLSSQDLERRLVLEAQITGHLQHPGIPPVHKIGKLPDGRPFFARKLIKGRTLDELLQVQPLRTADLQRFLGIFEQVCQAVAYAHSKGVIHRDLKPLNIMVGEFGEVQVMDWGLAKLLAREEETRCDPSPGVSESSTWQTDGAVGQTRGAVGTWAYMAPEAAKGEWDRADERLDVFGLGGILCFLLTGDAPYRGRDRAEVLRKAESGDLAEGFARLDDCGADSALVALAKECLCAERDVRPRNASVVAGRVTAYLAAVQEQLRAAEVERAAAQAKAQEAEARQVAEVRAREAAEKQAEEAKAREVAESRARAMAEKQAATERRARRLLLGLAGAVVAAVMVGSGTAVYWQQQRQRGREQALAGLAQAARLRAAYNFEGAGKVLDQVGEWVKQAADQELQQSLGEAKEDLKLVRDLDRMRQEPATLVEGRWNPDRAVRNYPVVLSQHGLDVLGGDSKALVEKIRASAVRQDIVATLDHWAGWEPDRGLRARVLKVAEAADESRWRCQVRAAVRRGDTGKLKQRAKQVGQAELTPGIALLLARGLGDWGAATRLLVQMQERYPQDFWVSFDLAHLLFDQMQYVRAVACWQVVRALRPESSVVHNNLGASLGAMGDIEGAIRSWREAIRLDPKGVKSHINLSVALCDKRDFVAAICSAQEVIRLDPTLALAHTNLSNALNGIGNFPAAIRSAQEAIRRDPKDARAHGALGQALLNQGHFRAAQQALLTCQKLRPALEAHQRLVAQQLKRCEEGLALEPILKAILQGKRAPADPAVKAQLAALAHLPAQQRFATAARLYAEALLQQSNLAGAHRYRAACCAALAGCGQGKDAAALNASERLYWWRQARIWLWAELEALGRQLQSSSPEESAVARRSLEHWRRNPDLAGVREKDALTKLPTEEQSSWRNLWAEVEALLAASKLGK